MDWDAEAQLLGHRDPRDVTPLNFPFWDFFKEKVYLREISDVEDHRGSMPAAIADYENATADMVELDFRLDILRATKEAHVEVY